MYCLGNVQSSLSEELFGQRSDWLCDCCYMMLYKNSKHSYSRSIPIILPALPPPWTQKNVTSEGIFQKMPWNTGPAFDIYMAH